MFATDDRGQRFSQADFSPDLYNGVQQMYTSVSGRQDSALSRRGRQRNDLTFLTNGHSFGVGFLSSFGEEI